MAIHLGLDIGAVSVKLAAVGGSAEGELLQAIAGDSQGFFAGRFSASSVLKGSPLVLSRYRRIQGNPAQSTFSLLREFFNHVPADRVKGIRLVGSGGRLIAEVLDAPFENEFRAVATAIRAVHPEVRTVFEMGGESSKYLRLDPAGSSGRLGIADYQSSGECAAGTGSFIDQQAARLLYSVEDVGEAAWGANCAARIAGRCSVFAKSDMIHAQQGGYTTGQILRGLCDAVARNFKSSIVKGCAVTPPVAFIGGVAVNKGVAEAIRQAFKLSPADFLVPELHAWLSAIGAAILEAEDLRQRPWQSIERLKQQAEAASFESGEPLSLANVILLRDRDQPAPPPARGERVEAYLGIDVGSVSTNLVVLDAGGRLLKEIYVPTQGRPLEVVQNGLKEIASELGGSIDIRGVGTTGSGRELSGEFVGADTVTDEITAHKTGAMYVSEQMGMEPVDTIFEIGGQDSKFIRLEKGVVVDFTMNEACAAGTGSFLEEQAAKLGISIKNEFARLALASRQPARLGERCTVFMERDVTAYVARGARVGDLAAGLAYSVALNYLHRVVRGRKLGSVIFFQGGTAYNDAVAAAFSQILGQTIIVPPHNGVIGAIGMALLARHHMQATGGRSRFRGYDLSRLEFSSRDFVCRACSNYCEMKEFIIEGERSFWGDQCSDMFHKRARSDRRPVIRDLMEYHDEELLKPFVEPRDGRPKIGIPRAMFFYDRFPFWCAYFQELGFEIATSAERDRSIAAAGEDLAVAQPCFPVQVAHGHVRDLIDKGVEHILLPNVVNVEAPPSDLPSHLCPWNQTLPFVIRAVPKLASLNGRYLIPTLHFRLGRKRVMKELAEFSSSLDVSRRESNRAAVAGYEAQERFDNALLGAGAEALQKLEATGEPGLILVGRPYNLYDRGVNCDIPRKLRDLYGVNVIPMDFLPLEGEDITEVHPNMFWNSGRRILAAAQFARRHPKLHLIYISNFKCGPDSYIKSFLSDAAGKPSLVLQFDGHANDAGYLTRCEAYLDSKGFLRCPSPSAATRGPG
ncbi:MAG: acyl-CoA dehydratase activase [Terriglobia bacterium]